MASSTRSDGLQPGVGKLSEVSPESDLRGAAAPRAAGQMPLQYDLTVGDLVVAATAWKGVMVGDRGVVVEPREDLPYERCLIKFDDGKGTYVGGYWDTGEDDDDFVGWDKTMVFVYDIRGNFWTTGPSLHPCIGGIAGAARFGDMIVVLPSRRYSDEDAARAKVHDRIYGGPREEDHIYAWWPARGNGITHGDWVELWDIPKAVRRASGPVFCAIDDGKPMPPAMLLYEPGAQPLPPADEPAAEPPPPPKQLTGAAALLETLDKFKAANGGVDDPYYACMRSALEELEIEEREEQGS